VMKIHVSLLSLLSLAGCGPGVTDGEFSISNGYAFFDPGGVGRMITYENDEGSREVVIDPRVDSYVLDGQNIVVARRPWMDEMRGNVASGKLSQNCEYWIINTATHSVARLEDNKKWPELKCDPAVTY
jgi:hypothetical protein